MRILHTSDWHLGQHFMGKSRQAEHQALIDWLLEQVQTQAVDAVLIAGDIFDTGAPPSYARALYSQLVARLHAAGVALLLLGGNHDSASVLEESRALLACLNTTVIAAVGEAGAHVVTLPTRDGRPGCIVCALPFIRARDVVQSQAGQSAQEKQQTLQAAIQATYQAVYARALARRAQLCSGTRTVPIIATGHLTTVGASRSDAVREIYVGTLEAFATSAFPPADYIALGHIHKPQKVAGLEHIRYCGAPIPLAFDEARQAKQMLLVAFGDDGLPVVSVLPVPVFQPLAALSGNLQALPALLASAARAGTPERPVWLEVTVSGDDYLSDLASRVQALAQGLPVEILRIQRQRGPHAAQLTAQGRESLDELSPDEVFARRLAGEALTPELHAALSQRYAGVVARLQAAAEGHGA